MEIGYGWNLERRGKIVVTVFGIKYKGLVNMIPQPFSGDRFIHCWIGVFVVAEIYFWTYGSSLLVKY